MAQGKPYMRIVKIIWRADAHIVDLSSRSFQLVEMSVEAFKFNEEITFWEIAVKNSHAVEFVEACKEVITGIFNSLKVTDSYISCYSYQSEILWHYIHNVI